MARLMVQGLQKYYGKVHALRGIDLDIQEGEFCVFVGPSGCGKSTLLRTIAGLEDIDGGSIAFDGEPMAGVPPRARNIAMVFQNYALYPYLNVFENIAFGLRARRFADDEIRRRVDKAAAMLGIGHLLERLPRELSGGQRQRVAIGRAVVRDARLFLFDEPLSNLDAKLRVEMRAEIKRLHQRTRTTTVYVTHDQVEAMTLGDRIAVMKDGVVQQLGSPAEIYGRPATRFVAGFIGSPAMNLLPVQRNGARLLADGTELATTAAQRAALQAAAGGEVLYGLRPEDLGFADSGLPGRLAMIEPTGPETYVTVDTAAGTLTARVPGTPALAVGEGVRLHWAAEKVHLFDAADGRRLG